MTTQDQKALYFDMDGTLADLYNVDNWIPKLRSEDVTPYLEAKPLVDMDELGKIIREFKVRGVKVGVISWGSLDGNREFTARTKKAKREWLERHNIFCDEFHVVKHGTPKHKVCKVPGGVIVDDNAQVRAEWPWFSIDASDSETLIPRLEKLLARV